MIHQPCSVIVAGPSGSGKSELVEQVLKDKKLFYPPPKKMVYCYDRWQPRFDRMKKTIQGDILQRTPSRGVDNEAVINVSCILLLKIFIIVASLPCT